MFNRIIGKQDSCRKKRRSRRIVWFVVIGLLAVSGAAGFILASNEPRVVEVTPAPSVLPAGADDSKTVKGASIEWEYEYRMCGHSVYLSCIADDSMVGLTFSQLQAKVPEARIIVFEPERAVLKVSFDCYCPRHYILKQYRGGLAVMRTILGTDEQEVYREINLRFDSLSKDEQEILEAGKLLESLDELELYLENLGV